MAGTIHEPAGPPQGRIPEGAARRTPVSASHATPELAPPRVLRQELGGGAFVLRSPDPLGAFERCIGEWLERWARETPDATALAERDGPQAWRSLTWAALRQQVGAVAQALIDLDLPAGDPVVVLSDNSLDHALLLLAAMHVGRPVCTVSSAYCRLTKDYKKIRAILAALRPGLVYAGDGAVYGAAIVAASPGCPVVLGRGVEAVPGAMSFESLLRPREAEAVARAFEAIRADDVAKYLLTSGSTGHPKVVINTHRMLCANQQMMAQTWRFLAHTRPVLVDWLPWSHTFGANHNLNMVLRHGGTLFIDEGRPAPGLIDRTAANLREVKPTIIFNVPRGFDMLLPLLEADEALAADVFERVKAVFYAGAALSPASWKRLDAVAAKVRAEPLWMTTSWGATETSPAVTSAHWKLDGAGNIGNPLPGMELKFVPNGGKLEMRVRGVSVFPGYRDAPELTAQAFDEEGYYRIGDAGRLADPARPEAGVIFDGRVAEDFKLGTGTWVSVGTLRVKLISLLAPYAQDAVITGHDRDQVGALLFPSGEAAKADPAELAAHVRTALGRLKAESQGSSGYIARVRWLAEPPSADAGEITDKGYVNQRAVLARRAADVEALYAGAPDVVLAP